MTVDYRFTTPVLFIVFNRIETTQKVFEVIRNQKPSKLFVAADGPRPDKPGEKEICDIIKKWVLNNIDWDCDVKTLFQEQNLGCGLGPATAISWFFNHVEEGIILEDDCVPDGSFFRFCTDLLEKFRHDNRISIISGANFDKSGKYLTSNGSYFFSVFPFTWGWATWKRNWVNYDYQIRNWGIIDQKGLLNFLFDDIEFQNAWKKVFNDYYKHPPSHNWDFQFFLSCFINKQLSVVPCINLISNIGHGDKATHTTELGSKLADIPKGTIIFPMTHPLECKRNMGYDIYLQNINYGRIENITLIKKIKRWVKKYTKKTKIICN